MTSPDPRPIRRSTVWEGMVRGTLLSLALLAATAASIPAYARATGFVRVEQIDGTWWFVDPDGKRFVSLGVNHIEPHLWLAPYNRAETLRKYGADFVGPDGRFNSAGTAARQWMERQLSVCADLNFNTLGKHTHPTIDSALYQDRIYYVVSLETSPLARWQERNGEGPRPDIFSPAFREWLEARVRPVAEQHRNSRRLLGYVYTDVPSWVMGAEEQTTRNERTMIYPWLNALLALGETSPGKQRWIEHLRSRYDRAEAAAQVWGIPVSPAYGISWDRLARLTLWFKPADAPRAQADMLAFLPILADQWYGLHREIILRHDPNHLLFGDKNFVHAHYDWLLPVLKKHVDAITFQSYEPWTADEPKIRRIHEATGKPVFNGDGCFGLVLPQQRRLGVKGARSGVRNFAEVAQFYREHLAGMMAAPYMLGWHHCGFLQQWDEAERGDVAQNENGFLDPLENYVTEWTEVIRAANRDAATWHEAARPGPPPGSKSPARTAPP
jgi:hypothetical protein